MYTPAELQSADSSPKIIQKVYTTHASGRDVFLLPKLLTELDSILIDIRFALPIQPIKWSKNYLQLLLKGKYLHVPTLGDRANQTHNLSGKPAIHNLTLGIKIITELKVDLLLFCACGQDETCHRHLIGREFAKLGTEVIEITDWTHPLKS